MNKPSAISIPTDTMVAPTHECLEPVDVSLSGIAQKNRHKTVRVCGFQSGKLHSRFAGYMAFGAAVFVSLMAAATVAIHDVPLMLGGF